MLHDIDRMDIPDRHRLLGEMTRKHTHWTDIGEAEVRDSLFGRAKVRIHRRRDDVLRAVRWIAVSGVLIAALVWVLEQWAVQPQALATPVVPAQDTAPMLTPIVVPPAPVVRVIEPQVRSAVAPIPAAPVQPPVKPPVQRVPVPVAAQPVATQPVAAAPVPAVRPAPPAAKVVAPQSASAVPAVPPLPQSAVAADH
ncbi:MAG: hypothetical protein AB1722_03485 [Pseudomonadota bacterium]